MPPHFDVSGDMGVVGSSSGRSEGRSDTESEAGTDPGGAAKEKEWGEGWEGGEGRTLRLDLKGELLQVPCGPLAYSIALVKLAPAAGTALVECLFTSLSCAVPDRAAAAQLAGCDLAGVMDDDEEEVY
ncbi:hypothetical protein HaLaN_31480, partial [Haematococcus lacustris]